MSEQKNLKLNIGSGHTKIPGYLNVDIDPHCKPDIIADARNLKSVKNETVSEILCSHVLEHFISCDIFLILREIWRALENQGSITVTVPDAIQVIRDYFEGKANICCLEKTLLGSDPRATKYMQHLTFFSTQRLERFLFVSGFTNIQTVNAGTKYEITRKAQKWII